MVVPISAGSVVGCDGGGTARYKCRICPHACEACKDKPLQSVPGHSPAHPMIRFTDSRPLHLRLARCSIRTDQL
jgi:hypothetical protein